MRKIDKRFSLSNQSELKMYISCSDRPIEIPINRLTEFYGVR